tara:strand:+ start:3692 stop:4144 length:453 start_codon:yes stop_codon:yes gene_type:complete
MKLFIFFLISFLFKYEIFANELSFTYDVKGTLVKEEKVIFPSGKKFISFRHEGGFETSIARYGFYYCTGSMLYTENGNLEDMTYACEFQDQNNDKFFAMGTRDKGSDIDRSLGKMTIIEGIGFWKKYSGKSCIYGLEYVEKIIFVKANCK